MSAAQKTMIFDADPVETEAWQRGLYAVTDGVAVSWRKGAARPDGPLFRSHFATCPEADEWRKR